jgi:hypothetical protein
MRWLIIICLMFVASGCREKASPKITLVIPDGFTGVAILRWQQPQGIKLPLDEPSYILEIPRSGVMAIQGPNLMLDWYVQDARYASGRTLPQGNQHTKDEEGVYLWDMGINADASECWYVVGQAKDREGAWEKKVGMPPLSNPPSGNDKVGQ